MPGRKWYAIAFLVFAGAAGAAGIVAFSRLSGLARELPQVVVPGEADLTFSRPGTYTIYLERNAVVNGHLYTTTDAIAGLRVRLTSPSGSPIELARPSVSSNYEIAGRTGTAVLSCTISEPGQYHLAAGYPDGREEPRGVLAIGLGVPGKIVATILLAGAIGLTGFIVAAGLAGLAFWRRRKAARSQSAASFPSPTASS